MHTRGVTFPTSPTDELPSANSIGNRNDIPFVETIETEIEHIQHTNPDAEEMFPQDVPPEPPPDLLPCDDISVNSHESAKSHDTISSCHFPFVFADNISDHTGSLIRSIQIHYW